MFAHRLFVVCVAIAAWSFLIVIAPSPAQADISNFDLAAKIYTKWLFRNNDRQGNLWLGHPAEKDNYSGDNGVASEFELTFRGKVSRYVNAGVRIKSRFGAIWHNWWENGDMRDIPDNSGESLGMNHAEYIRLRGYWFRIKPPVPWLNYIHVGSSDYSQFNPWTIGKIRFIDRDNGKGIFVDGGVREVFHFHLGIIPLPKMWVGPGWTTGLGDTALSQPFYGQDYAYALRLDVNPVDWLKLQAIGTVVLDWEANRFDADAVGSSNPNGERDGAVGLANRFMHIAATLEGKIEAGDNVNINLLFAYTDNRINELYATNRIPEGGFYNMVWGERRGIAFKGRIDVDDPFEVGFSMKAEGFYISPDYNSAFGARRESDVLLTDGFLGGGQLPTLNIANEFMDFDEPWFESIIGWAGGTVLFEYAINTFKVVLEGTFLTYTTNNPVNDSGQTVTFNGLQVPNGELLPRDVDNSYPSFPGFHQGLTDTDFFNNINRQDFGRDTRSVYRRYQDRMTFLARLTMSYTAPVGSGLRFMVSGKYIRDTDGRRRLIENDNYVGDLIFGDVQVGYTFTDWLNIDFGFKVNHWRENRVFGTDEQGYSGFITNKYKPYMRVRINFGGVKIYYYMEFIHRTLLRDRHIADPAQRTLADLHWNVFRSKATAEVAW